MKGDWPYLRKILKLRTGFQARIVRKCHFCDVPDSLSLSIRGHLKWNHSGHPKWGHHYYPKWDFKGHPKWDHHYWHPKRVGKGIQTGTITSIMGSIGATEVLTTSTGI
jgi:hypothetical protein